MPSLYKKFIDMLLLSIKWNLLLFEMLEISKFNFVIESPEILSEFRTLERNILLIPCILHLATIFKIFCNKTFVPVVLFKSHLFLSEYCCVKLTLSKCWFNIEQEIIWSGTGKTFEPGLTFFLLIIENWTDIPCKACNINTRKKCIIAVIHSGICCFTLRSFTSDEFTSLKSMLPFWKFIYDKLRFTCFEHYLFMYSLFRAGNSKWSAAFKY